MCVWFVPAAMVAITAVSSAASIASANAQAKAQNAQAESAALVKENQALIARNEGAYAEAEAARAASEKRRESDYRLGATLARQGASGVLVHSGSNLEHMAALTEMGERDVIRAGQVGDAEAWRAENRARGSETSSALARAGQSNVGLVAAQAGLNVAGRTLSSINSLG